MSPTSFKNAQAENNSVPKIIRTKLGMSQEKSTASFRITSNINSKYERILTLKDSYLSKLLEGLIYALSSAAFLRAIEHAF